MNLLDIFLLAVALSVDAFIVSFSYGLILKEKQLQNAFKLALAVGIGQFIMPVIGWHLIIPVSHGLEQFYHWLVFCVFGILGLNIIMDTVSENRKILEEKLTLTMLFLIGIATSIDALMSGASLYFAKTPIFSSAAIIGVTALVLSLVGFFLHRLFKKLPYQYIEILSGVVLILLGVKVLCEHMM